MSNDEQKREFCRRCRWCQDSMAFPGRNRPMMGLDGQNWSSGFDKLMFPIQDMNKRRQKNRIFFLFGLHTLNYQSGFSGSIRSSSFKDISSWRWMTFVSDDISFWKKIHRCFVGFSSPQHWQKDTGETASLSRSGCHLHLRPKKLQLEDDLYNLVKLQPPFKVRIPWILWMDWYWYPLIGIVTNLE